MESPGQTMPPVQPAEASAPESAAIAHDGSSAPQADARADGSAADTSQPAVATTENAPGSSSAVSMNSVAPQPAMSAEPDPVQAADQPAPSAWQEGQGAPVAPGMPVQQPIAPEQPVTTPGAPEQFAMPPAGDGAVPGQIPEGPQAPMIQPVAAPGMGQPVPDMPQAAGASPMMGQTPAIDGMTGQPEQETETSDPEVLQRLERLLRIMGMPDSRAQIAERALATDGILILMEEADVPMTVLARRLCLMERPPEALVKEVLDRADTRIRVEVLENARLPSARLLEMVEKGGPDELCAIARRRRLPELVCSALAKRGEPAALLELARNTQVTLSEGILFDLVEASRDDEELQAALSTRADLVPAVAFRLFRYVAPPLRRHLIGRFLSDSLLLDEVLDLVMEPLPPADTDRLLRIEAMIDTLAQGDVETAAMTLVRLLGLHENTARWALTDPTGEPLVVVLRVLGYVRNTFMQAITRLLSSPALSLSRHRKAEDLQNLFDLLSFNKARLMLLYWDWDFWGTGPYAPFSSTEEDS